MGVSHTLGDVVSPLARSSLSRHQVVSRQSAGMQMCPPLRFNCYDSTICHRICSLPTALGPKLESVQDILEVWWIHLLPTLSFLVSDRKVYILPFPPSFALPCPSHLYASVLSFFFFFYREILVHMPVRSKGPNHNSGGRYITLPDGALMLRWISAHHGMRESIGVNCHWVITLQQYVALSRSSACVMLW